MTWYGDTAAEEDLDGAEMTTGTILESQVRVEVDTVDRPLESRARAAAVTAAHPVASLVRVDLDIVAPLLGEIPAQASLVRVAAAAVVVAAAVVAAAASPQRTPNQSAANGFGPT